MVWKNYKRRRRARRPVLLAAVPGWLRRVPRTKIIHRVGFTVLGAERRSRTRKWYVRNTLPYSPGRRKYERIQRKLGGVKKRERLVMMKKICGVRDFKKIKVRVKKKDRRPEVRGVFGGHIEHLRYGSRLEQSFKFGISSVRRSFWVKRFFTVLLKNGRGRWSKNIILSVFWAAAKLLGIGPNILIFEIFELFRYPFLAVQVQRGWTSRVRLVFLPWWRQYLMLLRWFAKSFIFSSTPVPLHLLVLKEVLSLFIDPTISRLVSRRSSVIAVSSQSRLALNYRWK